MLDGTSKKNANNRIVRWRLYFSLFNFSVIYRPDKENTGPHVLSRLEPFDTNLKEFSNYNDLLVLHIQSDEEKNYNFFFKLLKKIIIFFFKLLKKIIIFFFKLLKKIIIFFFKLLKKIIGIYKNINVFLNFIVFMIC